MADKRIKVTKKDERLARALLYHHLLALGYPEDKIHDQVDEKWPGELEKAKSLHFILKQIEGDDLDGFTTQEEIDIHSMAF